MIRKWVSRCAEAMASVHDESVGPLLADAAEAPGNSNQLATIGEGDKFAPDTIVAKLSNLQISGDDRLNCFVVAKPDGADSVVAGQSDDWVQHNNSVCVDDDTGTNSDLLAMVSEATSACEHDEHNDGEGTDEDDDDDDDEEPDALPMPRRQGRVSEGDGGHVSGLGGHAQAVGLGQLGKRAHNSKSMCDNDLLVDHLINKKDSMRIRFDQNGDAQIQKRDILHRKFYKSVDDELHKQAVASTSAKSQCMTLDRVFRKLRGQIRKSTVQRRIL